MGVGGDLTEVKQRERAHREALGGTDDPRPPPAIDRPPEPIPQPLRDPEPSQPIEPPHPRPPEPTPEKPPT